MHFPVSSEEVKTAWVLAPILGCLAEPGVSMHVLGLGSLTARQLPLIAIAEFAKTTDQHGVHLGSNTGT